MRIFDIFNKKKELKKLESKLERINSNLQKRVWKLENKPAYKVRDNVNIEDPQYNIKSKGMIVKIEVNEAYFGECVWMYTILEDSGMLSEWSQYSIVGLVE